MAFGFTKPRYSPIALDFGAGSVKLLQVVATDPPQLVAAAAAEVPDHARADATTRAAFLGQAVRHLLREGQFKGRRVMLSFPAFQTLMQHLEVERVEGESMDAQVGSQLRERLHVDPNRMIVRHFPVRQYARNGATVQEVICLAAARQVVMGYVEIAQRCKLDVVGMHSEPLAVLRAFEHLDRAANGAEPVRCFIDIGAAMTKVIIAHGQRLVFAKSIHAAGENFSREQPPPSEDDRPGLDTDDADAQTDDAGAWTASATRTLTAAAPAPAAPASNETLDCITDELQLCLRYHARLFPDQAVERLVFLGGQSRHTPTCQSIARTVRIAAQLGDPFARMAGMDAAGVAPGVNLNEPQPGWAVPMGLCLSEANL